MKRLYLALSVGLACSVAHAQQVKLSKSEITVSQFFKDVKKQTGMNVLWQSEQMNENQLLQFKNTSGDLAVFLKQLGASANLGYSINNNTIVIHPHDVVKTEPKQERYALVGIVRDKDSGLPLDKASVTIGKETVTSDERGRFHFKSLKHGMYDLLAKHIAMKPYVRSISYTGNPLDMSIDMEGTNQYIDEVVMTGYQSVKRENMSGAAVTLTEKDFAEKGFTSMDQALKGTVAGLSAMNISGKPGAAAQLRIRGLNSLTGDMNPIWIVDGMPMQGDMPNLGLGGADLQNSIATSGIGNIPIDDIESITILKDAAATAIYGSRAANGVIVVKTKRGRSGSSYLNVSSSISIDEAPKSKLHMMTGAQKVDFEIGLYNDFPHLKNDGRVFRYLDAIERGKMTSAEGLARIEELRQINTNWYDEVFRTGFTQNNSVSLSSGTDKTQFYTSLNYLTQQGVLENNVYKRYGASIKITHDFNSKLRVFFDLINANKNDRNTASIVDPLKYATFANPYERPYNADGSYAYDYSYFPDLSVIKEGYRYDFNILEEMRNNTSHSKYNSTQANVKLEYRMLDYLTFYTQGTYAVNNNVGDRMYAAGSYTSKAEAWLNSLYQEKEIADYLNNGSLRENSARSLAYTWRNQFDFANTWNQKHFVTAALGQEISDDRSNSFYYYSPEFDEQYGLVGFPDLQGAGADKLRLISLFGRSEQQKRSASFYGTATYTYDRKYVLSGSYRMDGVDIIGTGNRFTPLWNASFRYNMSREDFMKRFDFISSLSFRGSYGFTGSIDRNAYPFIILKNNSTSYRYEGEKVPNSITPANPTIKWQRKQDRSLGMEFALFDHRINGEVNYYNNVTSDLLDNMKVAISSGRDYVRANVASLRNSGWEFSINSVNIDQGRFRWSTNFNLAINKNKIIDTYNKSITDLPIMSNNDSQKTFLQGYSAGSWYGYEFAGVDPATGNALAYISARDANGQPVGHPDGKGNYYIDMDTEFTNSALQYLGLSYPPTSGGFGTSFSYGRLSLSTHFTFMSGHLIRSFASNMGTPFGAARYNLPADEQFRWRQVGDVTHVPSYNLRSRSAISSYLFSSKLEKGAYLKMNNVSLSYALDPKLASRMGMRSLKFVGNIQNLFTATKYRGIDPETMGAFGYPSAKQFNLNINVGF
ncbi:SusC/RagA family TonB-linked outer membrane protein [Sphingobacterium faecale]|uniref:SusC/RagA family TonB-linked outer membrane protein n=1 Tax=Sphingobacterium faecale TaxID=2803775 RepID=A0ABS1QXJ9_9SPHI|nr:SusC/RagA family TonB-linked outer membrane protein [Sphingobacterium faecale]MBL1407147.1 SusC/RagA family TonB-linked outer membrane protein [Sphingobacterium faecale]